jgi:hypothetical protein
MAAWRIGGAACTLDFSPIGAVRGLLKWHRDGPHAGIILIYLEGANLAKLL